MPQPKGCGGKRKALWVLACAIALGLLAACGGDGREATSPPAAPEPASPPAGEEGTVVRLGSASVSAPGQPATVALVVEGLASTAGLGAYDVTVEFDSRALRVDDVSGGDGPFSGQPQGLRIDNTLGVVRIAAFHGQTPGPRGTFALAHLRLSVTLAEPSASALQLVVNGLFDSAGRPVTARVTGGTVALGESR